MKNTIKKRAFVSAIAMLIVSAIVLTSSTFAWFSMSKQATVESMDLTVTSPEGIQISANASTWTSSLTVDEIFNNDEATTSRHDAYEGNANLYPKDLIPVSSAFYSANTGKALFVKGSLDDASKVTLSTVTQLKDQQDAAGFIAFDIFFKVANATTVYFSDTTIVDNSGTKATSAMRVAFDTLGNGAANTDAATATAWSAWTRGNTVMYEIDSATRSDDAAALGIATGAQTTKYLQDTTSTGTTASNGIVVSGNSPQNFPGKLVRDTDARTAKCFNLAAGITKMRVYIWVEGQDCDCLNSIAGAALTANLVFTID